MTDAEPMAATPRPGLIERVDAVGADPFTNAFLRFALDAGGDGCEQPAVSLAQIDAAVGALTAQGFEARAERLGRYLEVLDPEHNAAELDALFAGLAAAGDVEVFSAALERPAFGIVLTGHPTFALNLELSRILVELAVGRDASGEALGDAERQKRLAIARAAPHAPPAPLTLDVEHDWSLIALHNAWSALEAATRAALRAGRARWPKQWRQLTPRLLTVATWVGFDQDGRTDVTWLVSFAKRLSLKREALKRYLGLAEVIKAEPVSTDLADALAAIAQRLTSALEAVDSQAEALSACHGEPDCLAAFSRTMIATAAQAMPDGEVLQSLISAALALAPAEDLAESLLVLRSRLSTQGLGLAHVHVRLNASQLHSAIKAEVGLETGPADPARRRTYFARMNELIGEARPQAINFGSLAREPSSAKRLMMTIAQMAKFIDAAAPVRFLVAETESGFTLLSALYLAKLFGVEDRIEISPLFETESGLADGERLIEEALRSPHFRAYLERQGRLAIEFGFSDSGRFIGQMAATFRIERLRLRLADLLKAQGLAQLEVVFFNTHGESIGRGGHPDSLSDRFRYAAPPRSRAEFTERGIRVKEEDSFQGGEGYLPLLTSAAALASVRSALHFALAPDPEAQDDPIYAEEDFASEFFAGVQQAFTALAADPDYTALLGLFGTHLLPRTGSRPVQRQASDGGAPRPLGSVSELRAIPNNGLLQQLGYLANTLYGVGAAAAKDPGAFSRIYASSPRFRRALRMVAAAGELSDLHATRAYAATLDPVMWLDRAAGDASCKAAADALSRLTERVDAHRGLAGVTRLMLADALRLPDELAPAAGSRRERLRLLHALRITVVQRICLLAAGLPSLPATADITLVDLQLRILRLDVPWAVERLKALFPLQEAPTLSDLEFGEPATYSSDSAHSHALEHRTLFEPLQALFDIALGISTAISHEIGACG